MLCGARFPSTTRFCPVDGQALRPERAADPLIGTMVAARYLVERKIGAGGMGTVYLAEQVTIQRKVALKILQPGSERLDPDAPLRFAREASNASRLAHPHVASVYDFGEERESGALFIAMEYVDGDSLAALIRRERVLPVRRAAVLAWQIADAVQTAHELGVVHRDLKPDNVMLMSRPDGSDFVKVVDFGISRAMDSSTQKVTLTGLAIGTPLYMSPEQLGAEPIDARADVFALGLVCYLMLTGELPWPSVPREQLLTQRVSHPRRLLSEIRPDIPWPPELQLAIDRAIAIRVDERYASISQFATDLMYEVRQWLPDNPGSQLPWERNVRMGTPSSAMPIQSGAIPIVADPRTSDAKPTPDVPVLRLPDIRGEPGRTTTLPPAPPVVEGSFGNSGGKVAEPAGHAALAGTASRDSGQPVVSRPPWARFAVMTMLTVVLAIGLKRWSERWQAAESATSAGGSQSAKGSVTDSVHLDSNKTARADSGTPSDTASGARQSGKGSAASAARTGNATKSTSNSERSPTGGLAMDSTPPPPRPNPEPEDSGATLSSSQIREMLDALGAWSSFDAPADSALKAIRLSPSLLEVVRTREDSVEVRMRELEANLRLNREREACRIALSVELSAKGTRFSAKLRAILDEPNLGCRSR